MPVITLDFTINSVVFFVNFLKKSRISVSPGTLPGNPRRKSSAKLRRIFRTGKFFRNFFFRTAPDTILYKGNSRAGYRTLLGRCLRAALRGAPQTSLFEKKEKQDSNNEEFDPGSRDSSRPLLPGKRGLRPVGPYSLTRLGWFRLPPIDQYSSLLPPVGVWTVSQFQGE